MKYLIKAGLFILFSFLHTISFSQDAFEPNNNHTADLEVIATDFEYSISINELADEDWFIFEPEVQGVFEIAVLDVPLSPNNLDIDIQVFTLDELENLELVAEDANTGSNLNAQLEFIGCTSSYLIRVKDGNNNAFSSSNLRLRVTLDEIDACECNNTVETACLITSDATFQAKLWGQNYLISDESDIPGMDLNSDQDWYKVEHQDAGVLSIEVTSVNSSQEIEISCYDKDYNLLNNSDNVSGGVSTELHTIVCDSISFIRIFDRSGFGCGNQCTDPYDLSIESFQVEVSFSNIDGCECNNTVESACEINENSNFESRLWGQNYLISDESDIPDMDLNSDQDWYKLVIQECGLLSVEVTSVHSSQEIEITLYNNQLDAIINSPNVSGGQSTSTAITVDPGEYYIQIFDRSGFSCGNQCTDPYDLSFESFTIDVNLSTADFFTSIGHVSCKDSLDGSIEIEVLDNQIETILWCNGETTNLLDSLGAGSYCLTVTDIYGCNIQDTIVILEPSELNFEASIINPYDGSNGSISVDINGGTPPYSYLWNDSSTSNIIDNIGQGQYNLIVLDSNGCHEEQTWDIIDTQVFDLEQNRIEIRYTNPAEGFFELTSSILIDNLLMLNSLGQEVYISSELNSKHFAISTAQLEVGIYSVHFQLANGQHESIRILVK